MTEKQFASKVAAKVGFPIVEILTLIQVLWPIIQKLPCFKTDPVAGMAGAFRDTRKKKAERLPGRCAVKMISLGYASKAVRHKLWDGITEVGFDHSAEVAAAAAA